jgi:predicted phosphohydrolase
MVSIQYLSDIHLEHHDKRNEGYLIPSMFIKPSAPYLALCGDIGNPDLLAYGAFLGWCSRSFELVFLVAGNHEYYNYRSSTSFDMGQRKEMLRSLTANYKNVMFLDCSSYYLANHNLRILGCTLWSDTSSGSNEKIIRYMNDTRNILKEKDQHLLPKDMTALHFEEKNWLNNEIEFAKNRGEDVLVLTHYLPSFRLTAEKYKDNPLNMCFASDCETLMRDPVKAWICGHSHTGIQLEINGVKCRMNPYGYPGEHVETRNTTAVLQLGTKDEVVEL